MVVLLIQPEAEVVIRITTSSLARMFPNQSVISYSKGDVTRWPAEDAKRLIAAGYAERLDAFSEAQLLPKA